MKLLRQKNQYKEIVETEQKRNVKTKMQMT
jgi:hypothetical protein